MNATPTTPSSSPEPIEHPGYDWVADAACGNEAADPFFVDAGRVIEAEILSVCRFSCPVRRECVIHSYLGAPGETMIGAGYFGGFSLGQRKAMTLRQALARVARDEATRKLANPGA